MEHLTSLVLTDMEIATIHGLIKEQTTPSSSIYPVYYQIIRTDKTALVIKGDDEFHETINTDTSRIISENFELKKQLAEMQQLIDTLQNQVKK